MCFLTSPTGHLRKEMNLSEKSPAHQHYPKDFLAETIQMTASEAGVYIWLRGECWMNGYIYPTDPRTARGCKMSPEEFATHWKSVEHLFTESRNGGWIHPGVEIQRGDQESRREERAKAGRAGAKSRWQSHDLANGKSMANDGSASASSSSTSSSAKNTDKLASLCAIEIQRMQQAYPSTEFASKPVTASLVNRILDYGGITSEEELRQFAVYVSLNFRQGRDPGSGGGPRGTGLLVEWAKDWRLRRGPHVERRMA